MTAPIPPPLRIGVIGLGHLGSLHAKMLAQMEGALLAQVYDTDPSRRAETAALYHTTAAPTLESLLDAVDAVSIATPTSTHFAIACEAVERGKHVFIEKPITETLEQARALNALAERHDVLIQVGHIERFNPALVALDAYRLDPLFVESHRLAPFNPRGTDVPVVLDLMIHDIDIILSLVESPVVSVDANGVAVVSDTADIANARLKFANGCVANITASRISQSRMRKMRLFQQNAYISLDFLAGTAEVFRITDEPEGGASPTTLLGRLDQASIPRRIVYEHPPAPEGHNPLRHELMLFIEAVRTGRRPLVDGRAAERALDVAERILAMIENSPR
ncbi:MAG: Gfo/Idh/MocA family oxidoreductase [Bacteroidota bacterium]|nr:Gfo/Idh/MocA family oxidoreductase [Bacteroidota bacterium]